MPSACARSVESVASAAAPARRAGWTPLPIKCPRCADHRTHPTRLKDPITVVHGGAMRCEACNALVWVFVALKLRMAFVAEVTSAELVYIDEHDLGLEQLFELLGVGFPYATRPATRPAA